MSKINESNKKIIQISCFVVAILFNIWGILSIMHVNGWVSVGFLSYLDSIGYILLKYVIIVATMATGIMTFTFTAGTLKGKLMKRLTVGITVYSTILTLPLLLSFILFIVTTSGTVLPAALSEMVDPIANDFVTIFKNSTLVNVIFIGGVLMSIIFLAFPIFSAITTIKKAQTKQA